MNLTIEDSDNSENGVFFYKGYSYAYYKKSNISSARATYIPEPPVQGAHWKCEVMLTGVWTIVDWLRFGEDVNEFLSFFCAKMREPTEVFAARVKAAAEKLASEKASPAKSTGKSSKGRTAPLNYGLDDDL